MGHFECGVDVLEWGVEKMGLFQRRVTKPISSYVIIFWGADQDLVTPSQCESFLLKMS